jgi:flagellar motor component MotA
MAKPKPYLGDVAVLVGCIVAVSIVIISDLYHSGTLARAFTPHPVQIVRAS